MLFSEPKIPQFVIDLTDTERIRKVSVLFSEPKIPQFVPQRRVDRRAIGFSALQRAENSSISLIIISVASLVVVSVLFSEPKIPQFDIVTDYREAVARFSALQRAENSSIRDGNARVG